MSVIDSAIIALKAPQSESTPAHLQMENQFQAEQVKAEHEHHIQKQQEYLERPHRF